MATNTKTKTTDTTTRKVGEPVTDFGAPKAIKLDEIPDSSRKGGTRGSNLPAMKKWLEALEVGSTYQLPNPTDADDESHPVNRVAQFKAVAKEVSETSGKAFNVITRPKEVGKRYFIYVTVEAPSTNGDAATS